MAKIEPAAPRSIVNDEPEGLRIVIPARQHLFLMLFLAAWLCGWAVGEVTVLDQLLEGQLNEPGAELFAAAWLILWTVGGGFVLYALLWGIAGREVVVLTGQALVLRREIFGIGRSREFDLDHVRDLRFAPAVYNPWDSSAAFQFWGIGGGSLAFDYGARTYRFGAGVDEAEAKFLAGALKQRCPAIA